MFVSSHVNRMCVETKSHAIMISKTEPHGRGQVCMPYLLSQKAANFLFGNCKGEWQSPTTVPSVAGIPLHFDIVFNWQIT
jgi:hypothetical protein